MLRKAAGGAVAGAVVARRVADAAALWARPRLRAQRDKERIKALEARRVAPEMIAERVNGAHVTL